MKPSIEFGQFIRKTRLAANITGRAAAESAGMLPSNFSKLEHGALNPPQDTAKLKQLALAIGIAGASAEESTFFDLAAKSNNSTPVDLAEIISREDALPLLLRTIGNKRLSSVEIERLTEIVRGKKIEA